jgi:inner membrane protein
MDNLCHTLVGAAMAQAGLKRQTRFGMAALLVSANLPDLDVLVFATDMPAVAVRRGWTHGVFAQVALPAVLAAVLLLLDRLRPPGGAGAPRVRAAALLALAYAGVLSHVFLDYLNTYGIRLLMPLSDRWFYGDAVFIVDPWLWLTLGAGVMLARRRAAERPARVALALAAIYIGLMLLSASAARRQVRDAWVSARGAEPHALMVGPAPINPFRKQVIADAGDAYVSGSFDWRTRETRFAPSLVPKNGAHPAVAYAREQERVRAVLAWSRFPYFVVEPDAGGARVTLRDMRFGARFSPGGADVVVPDP